jgi:hypothetical protein
MILLLMHELPVERLFLGIAAPDSTLGVRRAALIVAAY